MPRNIFRLAYSVQMNAENSDTAEIMLYGQIIRDMPEAWKWSKEDKSAADFDKAVKQVRAQGATKLLLRINSPGGTVSESVAMRSTLANAGFEEINIRIEGICASSATNIATLSGAHVAITEGSSYMIHRPMGGCQGFASDLENYAKYLRNIEQVTRDFYVQRSGQSEDQVKAWMDAETWFTADQAVEYGFADEVQRSGDSALPAVACVSSEVMAAMRGLYNSVPEQIAEFEDGGTVEQHTFVEGEQGQELILPPQAEKAVAEVIAKAISNAEPVAGEASENTNHEEEQVTMDIKDINVDQLRADNPALLEQIRQSAIDAERQRIEDITALTMNGFEQMAEEAKRNGTSAADFQRQVVKAQRDAAEAAKQQGANYLAARQADTKAAEQVAGGATEDNDGKTEAEEIKSLQEEVKGFAATMQSGNETMY